MSKQLFVGLAVEGNTDMRFLKSIVVRTYRKIILDECEQEVDIDIYELSTSKIGKNFPEFVQSASKDGVAKFGMLVLAIHADSDKDTLQERLDDKFKPALDSLAELDDSVYCKNIVPIIPIRMMEAWMLADTSLLKEEMGTTLANSKLGFYRAPESIADPKALIEEAIRIVQNDMPKKRRTLSISDLYGIVGDEISLEALSRLSSYASFTDAVRDSLRRIHYLI